MKKLYTVLSTLCLAATALTAGAQTTADIAGTYSLSTELSFTGFEAEPVLPTNYDVTITASETSADSLWMDGYELRQAVTYNGTSITIPAGYAVKADGSGYDYALMSMSMGDVTFEFGEDNTLELSAAGMTAASEEIGAIVYITDATASNTTYAGYEINEEYLIGTWELSYTLTPSDGSDAYETTTKFIITKEDGQLYLSGIFGSSTKLAITTDGKSITVPATMEINDSQTAYLLLFCSMKMSDVVLPFGEDNTILIPSDGVCGASESIGMMFYIFDGTAKKTSDSTEGISAITAAPAANAAIYTLDGRKVKSTEGKGVFIVNGKKVIK